MYKFIKNLINKLFNKEPFLEFPNIICKTDEERIKLCFKVLEDAGYLTKITK